MAAGLVKISNPSPVPSPPPDVGGEGDGAMGSAETIGLAERCELGQLALRRQRARRWFAGDGGRWFGGGHG